ncbi:MAG: ABC transporter permease [Afipia felis]|nr:ABC transporter permease [Afipia felis]
MVPFSINIVPRRTASNNGVLLVPLFTIVLAVLSATIIFSVYGASPGKALYSFFIEPLSSSYNLGEVLLKATPLILVAQGLAIGFRAKVWNIGAEGQFIIGAICASLLPITFPNSQSLFMMPAMIVVAALSGMAWATIAAALRTRFNASEIIVTLMLTEVARQLLYYLVTGPLRDPGGYNFPQSVPFPDAAMFTSIGDTRANMSILICIVVSIAAWVFVARSFVGFRLLVGGLSPDAARYAGFSQPQAVWLSLLISGATAGLAGLAEVAGPFGKLSAAIPSGYGYAGIIVAFLGGLNPVGIVLAGLFMAVIYIGGDNSLATAQIPAAAPAVVQGLLLVYYLAFAFLINNEIRITSTKIARAKA